MPYPEYIPEYIDSNPFDELGFICNLGIEQSIEKRAIERSPGESDSLYLLLEKCTGYMQHQDIVDIARAGRFLCHALAGQKRNSGEPASMHSLEVAHILADNRLDRKTIIAGLTHDFIEDTKRNNEKRPDLVFTKENLKGLFGENVANMVDALTKAKGRRNIDLTPRTHFKIFDALLSEPRVILVKLADRLHNMHTIGSLDRGTQIRKALETLEVYVPLAYKLGLYSWGDELADLSFKTLNDNKYKKLIAQYDRLLPQSKLESLKDRFESVLDYRVKNIRIGRPPLYRLYRDNNKSYMDISEKQYAAAVTLVLPSKATTEDWGAEVMYCFHLIHRRLGEFTFASAEMLHDALTRGVTVELPTEIDNLPVKIRFISEEQEKEELASLFDYCRGSSSNDLYYFAEKKLRRLQEDFNRVKASGRTRFKEVDGQEVKMLGFSMAVVEQFVRDLEVDLITVISEDGKSITLPRGSTVLDAAYAFRTDIGDEAVRATIRRGGEKIGATLNVLVQEGDQVIIKKAGKISVEPSWFDYVASSYAEAQIRKRLRQVIEREKRKTSEQRQVTNAIMDRGMEIMKELFKRSSGGEMIVRVDNAAGAYADHHQRLHRCLTNNLSDSSEEDFLLHVGLNEIKMEGEGKAILTDAINILIEYQYSLVIIEFTTIDDPGVLSIISNAFGIRDINLEGVQSISNLPRQRARIICLIKPSDLPLFEREIRGELEKAKLEGTAQGKKIVEYIKIKKPR